MNKKFFTLWCAQNISLLGTNMSGFALGLYVYEATQSVMLYSLFPFFTIMPQILLAPLLGVFVDRWNRKKAMIIGHLGAGICTVLLILLFFSNHFNTTPILCLIACSSIFNGFTHPAFTAATTQVVPKEHLSRVSGMLQFGFALSIIVSPAVAGILMVKSDLRTIFLIDAITFTIAILLIKTIKLPHLKLKKNTQDAFKNYLADLKTGLKYMKHQPVLYYTLILLAIANFNVGIIQVLITPLVMGVADSDMVGIIWSVSGTGILVGSLILLFFKKINHRTKKVVFLCLLQGLVFLFVCLDTSLAVLAIGAFLFMLFFGLIGGINTVIWQENIPEELQGRVFSIQMLILGSTILLGYLLSGPLIDNVFNPFMEKDLWISNQLNSIMGGSKTPGIAALLMLLGLLTIGTVSGMYLWLRTKTEKVILVR